ncbi:MAG: hypothetical protein JNL32_03005 [Candidatus Kapabacteria bacterium]|nr:hypothetical protein [Candidatus Kapabacteria bacterium]
MKALLAKIAGMIAGLTTDDAKKAEVADLLKEIETATDEKVEIPEGADAAKHNAAIIQQLTTLLKESKTETAALKAQLDKLVASDDASKSAAAEAAKKAAADKAKAKIEEAIKAGRIPPKNEELVNTWTKQLEADFDTASKLIDAMPASATPQADSTSGGAGQQTAKHNITAGNKKIADYVAQNLVQES